MNFNMSFLDIYFSVLLGVRQVRFLSKKPKSLLLTHFLCRKPLFILRTGLQKRWQFLCTADPHFQSEVG